ncbi:hypothetical protein K8M07_10325 [Schnuerera sp. xch1]|uniref:hypothetical protein n=1 Tax=Schnuerera sp. xch1 TaxID=2874283 RepID=UPI001CBEC17D|nr:hypothetical protein [Schnuerera sp. xch1]MBZ2175631.1 hypothetical protein [Schnuerera sp. xch1]
MSKLFMYGTSLEGIEQLMVMVPNFHPRRSGIIINNYFNYEGGDGNCHSRGYVPFNIRPNIYEMEYKNLVKYCFGRIENYYLKDRLKFLTDKFKGEVFLDPKHKERFYNYLHKQDLDIHDISSRYIAILFLLTADETLWNLSKDTVKPNGVDFNKSNLKQISTNGYALFQTAKTISTGEERIKISEIADKDLINDMTFKAIINSALITRYGSDIFLITK